MEKTNYINEIIDNVQSKYPHLKIRDFWDTENIRDYLYYLVINHRDEPRQGFDLETFSDLLKLLDYITENKK